MPFESRATVSGAKTSHVRWFLVFWLFILSAVSYLDRVNISIAGGPIADAYHLSNVQLGKVFSSMLVGYALFTPGRIVARHFADKCARAGRKHGPSPAPRFPPPEHPERDSVPGVSTVRVVPQGDLLRVSFVEP